MEQTGGLEEVITRLRAEKEELEGFYYEEGRKKGAEFALEMDFETLFYVAKNTEDLERYPEEMQKLGITDYFYYLLHELEDPSLRYYEDKPTPMLLAYKQGWQEAVVDLWEQVKGNLQ